MAATDSYSESRPPPDLAAEAEVALQLAYGDPRRARPRAEQALAWARSAHDDVAASFAQQALGIAARVQGDIPAAVEWLRRAVRAAERGGAPERAADARLSLSLALAWEGRTRAALLALDRAEAVLLGVKRARLKVQRAIVLHKVGRHEEAFEEVRHAVGVLRRHGDTLWEARALCQRGLVSVERAAFAAADADLARAEELFRSLGSERDAAANRHNRGWCAARAGDVPTALTHYDEAERRLTILGLDPSENILDRAQVLLSVGVSGEAMDLARRAVECGDRLVAAEALLAWADAALAAGDFATAQAKAAEAAHRFARQRRPGWLALAHHVQARAAWRTGEPTSALLRLSSRAADELDRLGLPGAAGDARLVAGRTACALGRTDTGRRLLEEASRARRRGPAAQRAGGWLAEAVLRLADGRGTRSAERALLAGLRHVDEYRTSMGATELRAHASSAGADLATVGLRMAVDSGKAEPVLLWTERWRAGALRLRSVRPPDDADLAADLASLRRVAAELKAAAAAGEPTRSLLRQQTELEEAVRRRTRRAAGEGRASGGVPGVGEIRAALGDRALVEILEVDGWLHAVVVTAERCRLQSLGASEDVAREVGMVRSSLRRLAHGQGSETSKAAAASALAYGGQRLDEMLLGPVRDRTGDGPLVIVPPASLHALPWGILPSCRCRALMVSPSAAFWLQADRDGRKRASAGAVPVFVGGPGLDFADAELAGLAALYPGARCLSGPGAAASDVCDALDGADLAHVAAHGTFRADNPLFSSLQMADGPLTAYDLQRMRRAPRRLVLAACDSGVGEVHPGDELVGLAAVLFPLGTASIVASVVPVPDEATKDLMVSLHQRVRAGASLADALTAAREDVAQKDRPATIAATAVAAAFVCFGGG